MSSQDDDDGRPAADGGEAYAPGWDAPGPYRDHHIREGEPYELSNGHRIDCMTAGGRHGRAQMAGGMTLASDPAVVHMPGIDVGFSFNDGKNLRAPDLAVGVDLSKPGWAHTLPPLAVEYADGSQDEAQLAQKIGEMLANGTRLVWVVRLVGPLRVEVHEAGVGVRTVDADGELTAPGILQNPVFVRALIDPAVALEHNLHNLLTRKGYRDLDDVRAEGHKEGHEEGHREGHRAAHEADLAQLRDELLADLAARGWTVPPPLRARVAACTDLRTLTRWLKQTARADDLEAALR